MRDVEMQLRRELIATQRAYLDLQRQLNALQMERLQSVEAQLDAEEREAQSQPQQ